VSQVDRPTPAKVETLDAEDRAWLEDQLKRYSDLLRYLREH
jgi:hypothetical protein